MRGRKVVVVDGLPFGGEHPVRVESMLKASYEEPERVERELSELFGLGADLVRCAVFDERSAEVVSRLSQRYRIMADLHFNVDLFYPLARGGVRSFRVNPGTCSLTFAKEMARVCGTEGFVVRIGSNVGSLPRWAEGENDVEKSVSSVLRFVEIFVENGCENLIVGGKSSVLEDNYRINKIISERTLFPLHIGFTESGGGVGGIVKSVVALSRLLEEGIGDTLRVSLSSPSSLEVEVGKKLLEVVGERRSFFDIVACPGCSRKKLDVERVESELREFLKRFVPVRKVRFAVMGCEVNYRGEFERCDVGIGFGKGGGYSVYLKGVRVGEFEDPWQVLERILLEEGYAERKRG